MLIMTGIFLALLLSFIQISLALYALDPLAHLRPEAKIKTWPLLLNLLVMAAYLALNMTVIRRWIKRRLREQEEEGSSLSDE